MGKAKSHVVGLWKLDSRPTGASVRSLPPLSSGLRSSRRCSALCRCPCPCARSRLPRRRSRRGPPRTSRCCSRALVPTRGCFCCSLPFGLARSSAFRSSAFAPCLASASLPQRGSMYPAEGGSSPLFIGVRGRGILGSSRLQAGADLAAKAAGCYAHYPCPPGLRASSWDLWREIVTSSGDLLRFNFTRISRKRGTYLSRVEDRHFPA